MFKRSWRAYHHIERASGRSGGVGLGQRNGRGEPRYGRAEAGLAVSLACSRTTIRRNRPRSTDCQYAESDIHPLPFSKFRTLKRMPSRSTPASVVTTEPEPPVSSV